MDVYGCVHTRFNYNTVTGDGLNRRYPIYPSYDQLSYGDYERPISKPVFRNG